VDNAAVPRYLALDVGAKRVGIAVSDELGLTAQPVLTLERRRNSREDLQTEKVHAFAAALGDLTGLPIHLWDERLTTQEAHQLLYEAGHARQDHGRIVDQVAATLILQSFLDRAS
jgi:putative holliday junction resolvase